MSEEAIEKIANAWGIGKQEAEQIIYAFEDAVRKILVAIRKIVKAVFEQLKNMKISKCMHIYSHTKNRRIKNKQIRRMTDIVLNYIYT